MIHFSLNRFTTKKSLVCRLIPYLKNTNNGFSIMNSVFTFCPLGSTTAMFWDFFARMNSTGVKLNDQELRNAEFFGEFKTSMYTIAATHLPRWRRWGIATENDIARMQEVELTSEFAVMMKNGLTAKRRAWINLEYLCFDDHYPDRSEIASRFHTVMDTIDDRLGSMVVSTFFRRRTLFFGLFVSIYDLQFGLNSPLEPRKPRPLSAESVRRITSAGERLRDKSAPPEVLQSLTRRTTNEIERSTVHQYIQSGASDA